MDDEAVGSTFEVCPINRCRNESVEKTSHAARRREGATRDGPPAPTAKKTQLTERTGKKLNE